MIRLIVNFLLGVYGLQLEYPISNVVWTMFLYVIKTFKQVRNSTMKQKVFSLFVYYVRQTLILWVQNHPMRATLDILQDA